MLDISLNKSIVKSQDEDSLIILVARNPIGKSLIWDFLMKNWKYFETKYFFKKKIFFLNLIFSLRIEIPFYLDGFLRQIFKEYNSNYEFKKVEKFFEENSKGDISRAVNFDEILEQISINIRWMDANFEKISKWLNNF